MRNPLRFPVIVMTIVLQLLSLPLAVRSTGQDEIQVSRQPLLFAGQRFLDNGDGTITDTQRKLMWQKGDNGKEVTFEAAREYCRELRLGDHSDWRLPKAEERDTALAIYLKMQLHSPAALARFDLYWSSDPAVLLPFNYHPSYGGQVAGAYPPGKGDKAFVRAVRSLGTSG